MKMKNLKGINAVQTIGPIALTLVIAIFVVSLGGQILGQMQQTGICSSGTWGTFSNSSSNFPASGDKTGCCTTVNASDSNDCDTWDTNSAFNQTVKGLSGLTQFGDWWTVIVLAVILGIIVSVLYFYLGRGLRSSGY